MKKILLFIIMILSSMSIHAEDINKSKFDKLLPVLMAPVQGQEVTPKTTEELAKYFNVAGDKLPRIFVKKLPSDFAKQNNARLFSKVITALILRENETIMGERILFLLLKDKFDQNIAWTSDEQEFFDYLTEKYDATVIKTTSSKIMDLYYKIDEIPPALAVAQAALHTNWGSEKLDQPFGQKEWNESKVYDFVQYPDLMSATHAYVMDMNSTPNYDDWRERRINRKQGQKASRYLAQGLRTYMPEDTTYVQKILQLMHNSPFIYDYDNFVFQDPQ